MGKSLIDFARDYANPDKGRKSLSDYARSLMDADPTQSRTGAKVKASVDLSKPYGNIDSWDGLDPATAKKVIELQQAWGEPLQLNSTFRSKSRNQKVGGAKRSQHLHGKAVDISVRGMSTDERSRLLGLASALGFGGLGVYTNAIHVDTAGRRAWGPSYSRGSVPGWARSTIAKHEKNGFKGQAAELANGTLPGAGSAESGGREVAMDMPLPERKGTQTASSGKKGKLWGKETKQVSVDTTPGSAVTSPVGGKVVYAGNFRSYGQTVIVRGEDGKFYDISGMTAGLVQPGDQVEAGQPIGVAGDSTAIGVKGADGKWGDPTSLAAGLQAAGPAPVPGYDGGAMADAGTESASPTTGLMGAPASADYADAGLRGAPMMPGVAAPGYADAAVRGTTPNPASQIARALSAPSMDSSLMGGAPAPASPQTPSLTQADLDAIGQLDITPVSQADFEAATAPALNRSFTSQDLGGLPGYSNEGTPDMPRYGHELGPISTAFGSAPNISTTGLSSVDSADSYGFSAPAAPATSAMTADFSSDLNAPSYGAKFGTSFGMGSPPTTLGLVTPFGAIDSEDSYGFQADTPSIASAPAPSTAMSLMGPAPSMSVADVSPAAASAMGSPFGGFSPGPSDMSAAENFGAATGSFGGIGSPDDNQKAAFERGYQEGFAATAAGTPPNPERKVDAFAPGLRAFDAAFQGSVKSVGPKYSKALAAALTTPSIDNQVALTEASQLYGNMNGQPSKAVAGLRSQQIGDFAMANPALGNALGLSMGQQGTGPLGGGLGADPFGRGGGPMGGPSGGSGGGFGGPGGQPSGPSFGGPTGPSAGRGGGYGGGTSGGQPSGPSFGGPSGPAAGPGGGFGGGNPAGSPSPGGVTTGRGPSSNPGQGGGISAAAMAGALAGAKAAEAAAAASSDAARGFGGGYGGFGPSFSGGFF